MDPKQEEGLFATIVNAAPELDFLFALARRKKVSITISLEGKRQDIGVYVDSIAVGKSDRVHPTLLETSDVWFIEGHFFGDGKTIWSQIGLRRRGDWLDQKYFVWGSFQGTYNKSKRKGEIRTNNFVREEDFRLLKK